MSRNKHRMTLNKPRHTNDIIRYGETPSVE